MTDERSELDRKLMHAANVAGAEFHRRTGRKPTEEELAKAMHDHARANDPDLLDAVWNRFIAEVQQGGEDEQDHP